MPSHQPNPVSLLCFKSFNPVIVHSPNSNHIILGRDSLKPIHHLKMCKDIKVPRNITPHSHKLLISFPCTSPVILMGMVPPLRVMDSGCYPWIYLLHITRPLNSSHCLRSFGKELKGFTPSKTANYLDTSYLLKITQPGLPIISPVSHTAPATNPLASFRKMREKRSLDGQRTHKNTEITCLMYLPKHACTPRPSIQNWTPINKSGSRIQIIIEWIFTPHCQKKKQAQKHQLVQKKNSIRLNCCFKQSFSLPLLLTFIFGFTTWTK